MSQANFVFELLSNICFFLQIISKHSARDLLVNHLNICEEQTSYMVFKIHKLIITQQLTFLCRESDIFWLKLIL